MCFFVDRVGRRTLFLIATSGMLVVFIIWTICGAEFLQHPNKDVADTVVVMIFLYYCFYNTAWSGLLVGYGVEILPYNIRAKVSTLEMAEADADCSSGIDCHVPGRGLVAVLQPVCQSHCHGASPVEILYIL